MPTLFQANAARFWTFLTGKIVMDQDLSQDIPDCDTFFEEYGPSFELTLTPGRRPNLNSSESINDLLEEAFSEQLFEGYWYIHSSGDEIQCG